MRQLILSLLILATTLSSSAIRSIVPRLWSDGPLRASDFRPLSPADTSMSLLSAGLMQQVMTDANGNLRVAIVAMMDPEASISPASGLTPARLAYHQAQFDKLEVMARNLQKEVNRGMSSGKSEQLLNRYNKAYEEEMARLDEATVHGTDTAALKLYQARIASDLRHTGIPATAPLVPSDFGYGLYVGTGAQWTTGTLNSALSWSWDFTFGLRLMYRRLRLDMQLSYAAPTVENATLHNTKYDEPGEDYTPGLHSNVKNANYLSVGAAVGIDLLRHRNVSVVPFAGLMYTHYSWSARSMKEDSEGTLIASGPAKSIDMKDFNLWLGVSAEYRFNRMLSGSSMLGAVRQQLVSSLGLTAFAVNGRYNDVVPHVRGWQIGFMVSYSAIVRAMRIK